MRVACPVVRSDGDGDWNRGRRELSGASVAMVGMGLATMSAAIIDASSAGVSLDLDWGGRGSKKTCLEIDARAGRLRPI